MFAHFWLRQCCMVLRPHLYCLPSRFPIVRYLSWVLGFCGVSPVFSVVFALIARTIPAPVLVLALCSAADVAFFFFFSTPQFRGFRSSFGDLRNFSASASLPWLRLWCGLFCSVCLFSAYLYPPVAGLVGFSCGPPSLVVPVCVRGFFLRRRSCVFFFFSCSVWGRLLLSLFWCDFCASSWGACGFPRRVLPLVTLWGSATFLAPVIWPTPAVDSCCWVGGVLVHHLVFYLVPALLTLSGFRNLSGSS